MNNHIIIEKYQCSHPWTKEQKEPRKTSCDFFSLSQYYMGCSSEMFLCSTFRTKWIVMSKIHHKYWLCAVDECSMLNNEARQNSHFLVSYLLVPIMLICVRNIPNSGLYFSWLASLCLNVLDEFFPMISGQKCWCFNQVIVRCQFLCCPFYNGPNSAIGKFGMQFSCKVELKISCLWMQVKTFIKPHCFWLWLYSKAIYDCVYWVLPTNVIDLSSNVI